MPSERILICGAGVAGSVLAFWLAKYDFDVVVVERSRADQKAGQGIEIEEPALKVVKAMGILDELNERKTGEMGATLVDQLSRSWGHFEVGDFSPTGDLEIMRGDLTEVLYKAANDPDKVTYHFETTIQSLKQEEDKVVVELVNRESKLATVEEFDYVVGADGVKSRTRELAMASPEMLNCFKPIGAFVAYFSIPSEKQDWPYSRLCNFIGRRIVWIRPVGPDSATTSVYLIHLANEHSPLRVANTSNDRVRQKEAFAELYRGVQWEGPRVVEQMLRADNFYSDELMQVKLDRWSRQRVVLVGDAAWAPTPLTGQGNQLAIIGAWVLAQELSRNRSATAFDNYERRLRAYVEKCQKIPLNGYAPKLSNPQTAWGILVFRSIIFTLSWAIRVILWTKLSKLMPDVKRQRDEFDLEIENKAELKS